MSVREPTLEQATFEELRKRLVDRTRRNRLLHFPHTGRASLIRVVDELPDAVLDQLRGDTRFRFRPLPQPDTEPADERTPQFQAALAKAKIVDETYRTQRAAIDWDDPSAAAKEARIERALRDGLRNELGLPPRPERRNIDIASFARRHGIEPGFDLAPPKKPLAEKHTDGWLQTLFFPDQLKSRLTTLHRNMRSVEQETGVSTLHIAMGFLEWYESEDSDIATCLH